MSNDCEQLHKLCNEMKRFHYGDEEPQISGGVEVAFEEGETAHGGDRIVRVGKSGKTLERISQHFSDNFKLSVFKRWVLGAYLRREEGDVNVSLRGASRDALQKEIERYPERSKEAVTYMRQNMSFVFFEVQEEPKRAELVKKMTATVSASDCCRPSDDWLGNHSCSVTIRESGLWQTIDNMVLLERKLTPEELLDESDWSLLEKAAIRL